MLQREPYLQYPVPIYLVRPTGELQKFAWVRNLVLMKSLNFVVPWWMDGEQSNLSASPIREQTCVRHPEEGVCMWPACELLYLVPRLKMLQPTLWAIDLLVRADVMYSFAGEVAGWITSLWGDCSVLLSWSVIQQKSHVMWLDAFAGLG